MVKIGVVNSVLQKSMTKSGTLDGRSPEFIVNVIRAMERAMVLELNIEYDERVRAYDNEDIMSYCCYKPIKRKDMDQGLCKECRANGVTESWNTFGYVQTPFSHGGVSGNTMSVGTSHDMYNCCGCGRKTYLTCSDSEVDNILKNIDEKLCYRCKYND
jgi:hypothetical protein